eukprot:gene9219-1306_t
MNEPEFFEDAEEMGFIEKGCSVKEIQVVINEQPQELKEIFEIFDKKFSNIKLDIDKNLFAGLLLEDVNYVEHYGLERQKISEEKYEQVKPHHSWNADTIVTNLVTLNIQRHSDHHANAFKHYQCLSSIDEAPQLPTGYGGIMVLSTVPPLFFRVMNPLVESWNAKENIIK